MRDRTDPQVILLHAVIERIDTIVSAEFVSQIPLEEIGTIRESAWWTYNGLQALTLVSYVGKHLDSCAATTTHVSFPGNIANIGISVESFIAVGAKYKVAKVPSFIRYGNLLRFAITLLKVMYPAAFCGPTIQALCPESIENECLVAFNSLDVFKYYTKCMHGHSAGVLVGMRVPNTDSNVWTEPNTWLMPASDAVSLAFLDQLARLLLQGPRTAWWKVSGDTAAIQQYLTYVGAIMEAEPFAVAVYKGCIVALDDSVPAAATHCWLSE